MAHMRLQTKNWPGITYTSLGLTKRENHRQSPLLCQLKFEIRSCWKVNQSCDYLRLSQALACKAVTAHPIDILRRCARPEEATFLEASNKN